MQTISQYKFSGIVGLLNSVIGHQMLSPFICFRTPILSLIQIATLAKLFAYRQKVCDQYAHTLRICLDNNAHSFNAEQTSVQLHGKVTKYARKISFKDGNITSFTYIKTDETGNGSK